MNGYVGRLGSATATSLLDDYFERNGGEELLKFVETGLVDKTPALIKEIANLPIPKNPDVKSMLDNFLDLLTKSQGVIMLSDGTNIDIRYIFDANGCVGEFCWPSEVPMLNNYLNKHGGELLKELAKKGTVKITSKLMKEFVALPVSQDSDIQYLVDKLILLTKKSTEFITITDGFDDEGGDSSGPKILLVP